MFVFAYLSNICICIFVKYLYWHNCQIFVFAYLSNICICIFVKYLYIYCICIQQLNVIFGKPLNADICPKIYSTERILFDLKKPWSSLFISKAVEF